MCVRAVGIHFRPPARLSLPRRIVGVGGTNKKTHAAHTRMHLYDLCTGNTYKNNTSENKRRNCASVRACERTCESGMR